MKGWNPIAVYSWLVFFILFLGTDLFVWILRNPHIPTFSRVITRLLPFWVVVPLAAVLLVHFASIYRK